MVSEEQQRVADAAKSLYDRKLKPLLEKSAQGQIVVIEPYSGDYYVAHKAADAMQTAAAAHPNRRMHLIRIGQPAVYEIGTVLL